MAPDAGEGFCTGRVGVDVGVGVSSGSNVGLEVGLGVSRIDIGGVGVGIRVGTDVGVSEGMSCVGSTGVGEDCEVGIGISVGNTAGELVITGVVEPGDTLACRRSIHWPTKVPALNSVARTRASSTIRNKDGRPDTRIPLVLFVAYATTISDTRAHRDGDACWLSADQLSLRPGSGCVFRPAEGPGLAEVLPVGRERTIMLY